MARLLKMPSASSSVKLIGYSSLLAAAAAPVVAVTALHPVFERYMRSVQASWQGRLCSFLADSARKPQPHNRS